MRGTTIEATCARCHRLTLGMPLMMIVAGRVGPMDSPQSGALVVVPVSAETRYSFWGPRPTRRPCQLVLVGRWAREARRRRGVTARASARALRRRFSQDRGVPNRQSLHQDSGFQRVRLKQGADARGLKSEFTCPQGVKTASKGDWVCLPWPADM